MAHEDEHIVEVLDNDHAAPAIRRLTLSRPGGWSHRPGQVAELARAPGPPGNFALASAPDEVGLSFLIKEGPDTLGLVASAPGDQVRVVGPRGAGFELPAPAPGRRLVFVGAGTALAALRSGLVAAGRTWDPRDLALVIGVRRPGELAFADELARRERDGTIVRVVVSRPAPEDDWRGARGYVQDHLGDLLGPDAWVFVAGSDALEDAVEAAALRADVPGSRIQRNYRPDRRSLADAAPEAITRAP